ncbi:MAG: elongation factor G [Desulfobacterales bacterium]|nr:elongation factor G [Desulfobacterales bacterium]
MRELVEKIRNVALVAHGGAGKTSLSEVMLFNAGSINRIGRVEDGNTVMDFEPEEIRRRTSISTAFNQFDHKKHTIHIMDTPGEQNFFSDTQACMKAADGAILLIDAVDGVKVQSEMAWEKAEEYNLPCAIFINKIDRERADFFTRVKDAQKILNNPKPLIIQLPIGNEADFKGIVDLVSLKAYTYDDNGKNTACEIPSGMKDEVEEARSEFIEGVAEADDSLLEKYLEGEILTDEEIHGALKKGILSRIFAPVLCGAVSKNIGIDLLCDFIVNCMPSPIDKGAIKAIETSTGNEIEINPDSDAPFSAFVFKTIADPYAGRLSIFRVVSGKLSSDGNFYNVNKDTKERFTQLLRITGKEQKTISEALPGSIAAVAKLKETTTGDTICAESKKVKFKCADPLPPIISFALKPKTKGEEDKIYISLSKILEEDNSLKIERNSETKEILLLGIGRVHIESTIEKLKRKFNVEVLLEPPKVPYRETIKKKARAQGRHKKQSGGRGQFGDCWIDMEPLPKGEGFQFVDAVVGGVIPNQYIPAVEKGIREACEKGVIAGYPFVDFQVTLNDGSYHSVDSSEMAFKIAGSLAFKKAAADANPILLEPVMKVTIITPDEFMGDIMGDLTSRRGRVLGMDTKGKKQVINAQVPMSEFLTYAPDLRSITGGRGTFSMEFSHYDEVPSHLAEKIIEQAKKNKEE